MSKPSSLRNDGLSGNLLNADLNSKSENDWLDQNIGAPGKEALLRDIYDPCANVINTVSHHLTGQKVLPELSTLAQVQQITKTDGKHESTVETDFDLASAGKQPAEYATRLLVSGAIAAATYSVCGRVAGGLLRAGGSAAKLSGPVAKFIASESTAQIGGAAVHDFCISAKNDRERGANVAGGMATFSTFEFLNHRIASLNPYLRIGAQLPVGALGSAAGYLTHQSVLGEKLDERAFLKASVDGAALNLLLPGMQRLTGRMVDNVNQKLGRGIPLERHMQYEDLSHKSASLQELADHYALARVQASLAEMSINHKSRLIKLPVDQMSSGSSLAHELAHLKAAKLYEHALKKAWKSIDDKDGKIAGAYINARLAQENYARAAETSAASEINGRGKSKTKGELQSKCLEPDAAILPRESDLSDYALLSYGQLFAREFESYRLDRNWRPEHDYGLLSSEELSRLRKQNDPREIVESLYPELSPAERAAMTESLNRWKNADSDVLSLIKGMPRTAYPVALNWTIVSDYLSRGNMQRPESALAFLSSGSEKGKVLQKSLDQILEKLDKARESTFIPHQANTNYIQKIQKVLVDLQTKCDEIAGSRDWENEGELLEKEHAKNLHLMEKQLSTAEREFDELTGGAYLQRKNEAYIEMSKRKSDLDDWHKTELMKLNLSRDIERRPIEDKHQQLAEEIEGRLDKLLDTHGKELKQKLDEIDRSYKKYILDITSCDGTWIARERDFALSIFRDEQQEKRNKLQYDFAKDHPEILDLQTRLKDADDWLDKSEEKLDRNHQLRSMELNSEHQAGNIKATIIYESRVRDIESELGKSFPEVLAALRKIRFRFEWESLCGGMPVIHAQNEAYIRTSHARESATREIANLIQERETAIQQSNSEIERQLADSRIAAAKLCKQLVQSIETANSENKSKVLSLLSNRQKDQALASTLVFGKNTRNWLEKRMSKKLEDGFPEIPMLPAQGQRLGDFLLKHAERPTEELREIVQSWHLVADFVEAEGTDSFDKVSLQTRAKHRYPAHDYPEMAREAMKWNLAKSSHARVEDIYRKSLSVSEPFETEQSWVSGKYSGRFLPRNDVRRLFIGNYTGSCMRIGGANERGIIWAQKAADAGVFVVENAQTGEIVAGSRVWRLNDENGVCFNSIQSKGLNRRLDAILEIYKKAASDLVQNQGYSIVTVGGDNSKISLDRLNYARTNLPLPKGYNGLNDCESTQFILAR